MFARILRSALQGSIICEVGVESSPLLRAIYELLLPSHWHASKPFAAPLVIYVLPIQAVKEKTNHALRQDLVLPAVCTTLVA